MFQDWDSFFIMIGGAAGGMIGLLFVVVTLTAGRERSQALRGTSIYMTPIVVHFAVVLSAGAVAVAPRLPVWATVAVIALGALIGLGNAAWTCVAIGPFQPNGESPHWSDFWLYGAAPAAIYVGLLAVSAALLMRAGWAVDATAALLLSLLLFGIRNAWDLVTWMAPQGKPDGG